MVFDQVHRHKVVALLLLLEDAFVISLINQYTPILCTRLVVRKTVKGHGISYMSLLLSDGITPHVGRNIYSPNRRRTLLNTLSFSGSYG